MTWRLARSLETLRSQINEKFPGRSKAADGTIGDAKHASRSSDHNPWIKNDGKGIVTAIDITHDPANGVDSERLAEELLASRDPRIKYVISNRKIASGADGPTPWTWRKYSGSNAHNKHVHLSVEDSASLFDNDKPWPLQLIKHFDGGSTKVVPPLLKKGAKGEYVKRLQKALNEHGSNLTVDGGFGAATDRAVRLFQRTAGMHADGVVGPYTWEKLE